MQTVTAEVPVLSMEHDNLFSTVKITEDKCYKTGVKSTC